MSGETLFRAYAQLRIPAATSPEELRRVLENLATDVMVDVTLAEETGTDTHRP
jgi:glycine cleavage system regulatory protein